MTTSIYLDFCCGISWELWGDNVQVKAYVWYGPDLFLAYDFF